MSDGSTGRIVGTIVGAAAAYFTGGASYVALGATLGGAAGSLLDPTVKTESGRVQDLKVSVSKYGEMIPETWGNDVSNATAIWATDIIELPAAGQGGGGKGGGGTQNTNYLQFIQSMWCVGRTPELVNGVRPTVSLRKAWIDGKLNYDAGSGLSAAQALANTENPFTTVYLREGYDDQLPEPIIELNEGIGNVPAFRGRICIFIIGLQCPGGRVPQLQFEICIGSDKSTVVSLGQSFDLPDDVMHVSMSAGPTSSTPGVVFVERSLVPDSVHAADQKVIDVYRLGLDYFVKDTSYQPEDTASNYTSIPGNADINAICYEYATSSTYERDGTFKVLSEDGDTHSFDVPFTVLQTGGLWSKRGSRFAIGWSDTAGLFNWDTGVFIGQDNVSNLKALLVTNAFVWLDIVIGGVQTIQVRNLDTFALITSAPVPVDVLPGYRRWAFDNGDTMLYLQVGPVFQSYRCQASVSGITFKLESSYEVTAPELYRDNEALTFGKSLYGGMTDSGTSGIRLFLVATNRIDPSSANVGDIIASQSRRAGLTSDQFDVTTVNDTVWGYTMRSPASARDNITPLLTYAALGVVEEDAALRYFHRKDKTSVVTIPYEELGFAADGSEPGDPFPMTRSNAQEFPRSMTLSYNDKNFDYQTSTVKAFRESVDSVLDEMQSLAVSMDGTTAVTIVYRMLMERWLAQVTRSFSVSRTYAYLSAGDVATFLSKDGSYGDWMISKLTDTGASIEGECFPADSDLLIQTVPGPGVGFPGSSGVPGVPDSPAIPGGYQAQTIDPLPSPTREEFLDIPILQDSDNDAGLYVALSAYGTPFPGAQLFVGDDDPSLLPRGTVVNEAPTGYTETLLGDWNLNIIDESSTVTVNVTHHELNSITYSAMLSGNLNAAAIGGPGRWELIQFKTVSSLGNGRYILSSLLRGQRGTEWARGTHTSDDKFVLLSLAGILRPVFDTSALNSSKRYRAVTVGRSFGSATSQSYTNTGEGLKPFSPVNLNHDMSGADIVLTWDRRTRLSTNWLTGIVPLGESSERYETVIYSDSTLTTVTRVIPSTTDTATYTSAQQTADSYTSGPLYVRIFQLSDSVGRGHPLEATIT